MPRCTRCGGSFVWQTDLDGRRVVCLACGCEPGVAAAAAAMGKGAAAMTSEPQQSPAAGGAVERCVWCRQMVEAWHMTEHFQICPVRQQSKQANWPAAIAALPPPTPDAPCPQCGPGKAGAEIAEQALAAARAILPEPPTPDAAALRVAELERTVGELRYQLDGLGRECNEHQEGENELITAICDAIGVDPNWIDDDDWFTLLIDQYLKPMVQAHPWALCDECGWSEVGHVCLISRRHPTGRRK